jgi:hypothetical protein
MELALEVGVGDKKAHRTAHRHAAAKSFIAWKLSTDHFPKVFTFLL